MTSYHDLARALAHMCRRHRALLTAHRKLVGEIANLRRDHERNFGELLEALQQAQADTRQAFDMLARLQVAA